MITPSGVTAAAYWNAIKAGNPQHVRITFTDQNIVLTDEDIDISAGVVIDDILNSDIDLIFGKSVMKSVRMHIFQSEKTKYLIWTGEFTLEFGVVISGTTRWVRVGYFSGERPSNMETSETVELIGYDRMQKFEILSDDFFSNLTYPKTLKQMYHLLVDFVYGDTGSTHHYVDGDALTASFNRSYSASPVETTGYTCRDVLAWMAEAVGCYAKINAAGKCELVWFRDATSHVVSRDEEFHIEHADLYSGMIWNEFDQYTWNEAELFTWDEVAGYYSAVYGVRAVKVKQTTLGMDFDVPETAPWNVYTIMDNPFLIIQDVVNDPETYIKPIYDRLAAFGGQLPMVTDCVGNWCVETGDIITVHLAAETIHSPVFCRTLTWKGSVQDHYETTGKKFRDIVNDRQKQRIINNREIKMYVESRYYSKKSGIEITEEGVDITGGKHVIIDADTGKWTFDKKGLHHKKTGRTEEFQICHKSDLGSSYPGLSYDVDSNGVGHLYLSARSLNYSTTWVLEVKNDGTVGYLRPAVTKGQIGCPGHIAMNVFGWEYFGCDDFLILNPTQSDSDSYRVFVEKDTGLGATKVYRNNGAAIYYYGATINPSSRDIKHDIHRLNNVGDLIDRLVPCSFVYDSDPTERKKFGLIYEEAIDVLPEICTGEENMKAIEYTQLIPVLLKEIQSLRARVKALEERMG